MSALAICKALGGRSGLAFCPAHPNTRTPALSVKDGHDGKLLVHCFAGCSGADVLAALRARGLLEGRSDWKPDPQKAEQHKAEKEADDRRRIELARRRWFEAGPIVETLAEKYLRARGITCDLPPTLRFHPTCWHGPTATMVPAMVAALSIGRKVVGVHRTYLAEPGAKAFGKESKMMLGRCAGGAVRLSGGAGSLVVAEGVETAQPSLGPSGRSSARLGGTLHKRLGRAGSAARSRRIGSCAGR